MKRVFIIGLLLSLLLLGLGAESPQRHDPSKTQFRRDRFFLVFDGIGSRDKPDLTRYGLRRIFIAYGHLIDPYAARAQRKYPSENSLRALARQRGRRGDLVCLDFEPPMFTDEGQPHEANFRRLIRMPDIMHDAWPGLRLGYYGQLPQRTYWPIIRKDTAALEQWQHRNRQLDRLAQHVDVIFPSLYAFYDDPEQWVLYAERNLEEARKYGKQVYAFLYPRFHPSNPKLGDQLIPASFWRLQLDTCRRLTDGIVIWDRPDSAWDKDAPWWGETLQFIENLDDISQ